MMPRGFIADTFHMNDASPSAAATQIGDAVIVYDKEACLVMADALHKAFNWSTTPQGAVFWRSVFEELRALASKP